MSQKQVTVGTTPVILAQHNENRASISVSMPPTSIIAANTGVVYVGKGFVPRAVVGSPDSGDPINQGTQVSDVPQFDGDQSLFKGQWWAISDTAAQKIVVDETTQAAMRQA